MLVGERAGGALLHTVIQGSRVLLSKGSAALPRRERSPWGPLHPPGRGGKDRLKREGDLGGF